MLGTGVAPGLAHLREAVQLTGDHIAQREHVRIGAGVLDPGPGGGDEGRAQVGGVGETVELLAHGAADRFVQGALDDADEQVRLGPEVVVDGQLRWRAW
jgi:hypothetical protein